MFRLNYMDLPRVCVCVWWQSTRLAKLAFKKLGAAYFGDMAVTSKIHVCVGAPAFERLLSLGDFDLLPDGLLYELVKDGSWAIKDAVNTELAGEVMSSAGHRMRAGVLQFRSNAESVVVIAIPHTEKDRTCQPHPLPLSSLQLDFCVCDGAVRVSQCWPTGSRRRLAPT